MWGNAMVMLDPIFCAGKSSPMVLETLHPIPVQLDPQQPARGLFLALGLEGQAIPREAGPCVNASLPGEGAQHGATAPGERKRLRWSCGCAGQGADMYSLASPEIHFCFKLLSLYPLLSCRV